MNFESAISILKRTKPKRQQRDRYRLDPLNSALSIDAPLVDREGDPFTIADTVPDEKAEMTFEIVGLRTAVNAALATLPPEQHKAIVGEFWFGKKADSKTRNAALKRLRHPSISGGLRMYF